MPRSNDPDSAEPALGDPERQVTLTFHPAAQEDALALRLAELAQSVASVSGGTVVLGEDVGVDLPARPGLTLEAEDGRTIHYLALPEGPEEPPFLDALRGLGNRAAASGIDRLGDLERPAALLVFIAASCPHCPRAAAAANDLALASPLVTTSIVDAQQFPQLAQRFNVQSVPFTVLDGGLCLKGVVGADDLVGHLLSRDAPEFGAELFSSLVDAGRLDGAARHVLSGGAPDFAPAWINSTMAVRMALLLVSEIVLEEKPGSLDAAVPDLLPALDSENASLRGDTADLLGRIGHGGASEELERLLADPNPDVVEIAEEALDGIRRRGYGTAR